MEEHIQHVMQVFHHLLEHELFIMAKKSQFHLSSVSFPCYIIEQDGPNKDPGPKPTSLKQLHLAIENFYWRFLRGFG